MNTRVSMAKMNACIKATNNSNGIKITSAKKGSKKAKTVSTAAPAKTLPKSRKENERMRAASVTISKIPTKKSTGDLKLKYLLRCSFQPNQQKPKTWVVITETSARASVR